MLNALNMCRCWSCSGLVSSEERHLRRKRSSADLGTNYPGDLLSLAQPKPRPVPPLLKRNTIGDFASTHAYQQASTSNLVSTSATTAFDQGLYRETERKKCANKCKGKASGGRKIKWVLE